jgi:hypothetical protein
MRPRAKYPSQWYQSRLRATGRRTPAGLREMVLEPEGGRIDRLSMNDLEALCELHGIDLRQLRPQWYASYRG